MLQAPLFKQTSPLSAFESIKGVMLLCVLAVTALYVTGFTFDSFHLPKNVWVAFWTRGLATLILCGLFWGRPFRIMLSPITGLLALYVAIHALSGVVAGSPSLWRDETARLLTLFLFGLILQDYLYGNRTRLLVCIWALSLSSFMIAVWALYQDFAQVFFPKTLDIQTRLSDWQNYISSGLGNTGYIADYLAVLFPMNLLLYLHVKGKGREIFCLANLTASTAALVVCWSVQSNAGLICAAVLLLYYLIRYESRRFWRRRFLRMAVFLSSTILVTAFYLLPIPLNPHKPSILKQAFASGRWHYGGESRLVIWAQTIEIIKKNPILGCGAGNFTWRYPAQASPWLISNPERISYAGLYTNSAHNEILQTWAETGFAGPVILLILLILLWKHISGAIEETSQINRWIRTGALCALLCALPPAMMAYPLRLPASSVLFFAICALPIALIPKTKYFSSDVIIPVEFQWRNVSITVHMRNFEKPVGGMIHLAMKRWKAWVFTVLAAAAGLLWMFQSLRPIVSDTLFREGRNLMTITQQGMAPRETLTEAESLMRGALEWWPDHHDCRSTLGQMLFRTGNYAEAEKEILKTLGRLQARELYETLGRSREALGDEAGAVGAYNILFERNPWLPQNAPDFYNHYLKMKNKVAAP